MAWFGLLELELAMDESEAVVRLGGELDIAGVPGLRSALLDLTGPPATTKRVVLDLADLDFVDSTGLGVILAAATKLRDQGSELTVRNVRPRPRRVLDLTGAARVLTIEE